MDIPLYYKIYNDLLRKIGSEEYPPGSVLPTDGELEELYGVSKAPVRQALEKLGRVNTRARSRQQKQKGGSPGK